MTYKNLPLSAAEGEYNRIIVIIYYCKLLLLLKKAHSQVGQRSIIGEGNGKKDNSGLQASIYNTPRCNIANILLQNVVLYMQK